ncbi:sorting nexin-1a [Triplophysa rosa]|uniref:Sorting nexin-1 n=1 Tax=Triplophysa rosa TaxID=992332 RepID=A0A9W7X253_TRIRA|nr:sorting nexin-1a [Triplophysa rosa]KAI7812251.1 Snx1 protein [Triplophysa rosa]
MAASSERSPPPFPDSEEPELLEDSDSDDGAGVFTGTSISEMDSPSPVDTSRTPKDIFNEPPEDIFSDPLSDTNSEPQKSVDTKISSPVSDEDIDLFSDPLDDETKIISPTESKNPVPDLLNESLSNSEPPKSDVIVEPSDISKPGHKNDVGDRRKDIFEDLPIDGNKGVSIKKAASSELFEDDDEDDEDLFKEPFKAVSKKPSGPPVDVFTEVKSEGKGKAQGKNASTDLFAEEAVTAPGAKSSAGAGSKTNGVHSEEQDLFTEATVELSLDSPRNDRKMKDVVKPPVSTPAAPGMSASGSKAASKTLEELEEEESEDKFDLNISITNPEKVGDGMNAYMAYKVSTQTTLPMFRRKTFTVRRRFSDFLGLYEKLSEKHSQNGYIIPPPPEKSILGMTKVKVGKEDPSSAEFVERRRAALERYLQRVVNHPSLLQDPDVREFLEKEELPRAVGTQALSGAGFLKMINKATDAVSKMTIKMDEQDVWFDEKIQDVENEEQQLRKLHLMVESLVSHRKELSGNTAVFAKSVAMLGSSEDNTALSRALSQLAEVEDRIEQLHQDQASNDFFTFSELMADYIRLLGAVRGCFDQRMKSWQRWQDGLNMLQKKREVEAKLLWANKPDKLQQAKDEITEWESKVTQYERDFEKISATVQKEVIRFDKEKSRDFKRQIIKYMESLLLSQQQMIKYWEAFLPEAKAIA